MFARGEKSKKEVSVDMEIKTKKVTFKVSPEMVEAIGFLIILIHKIMM